MVRFAASLPGAILLCLLAAGCNRGPASEATQPPPPLPSAPAAATPGDPCRAAQLRNLVSHPATPQLRAAVARFAAPAPVRWVRPGDAVTTDYRAGRLNLILDETDRVAALRCG